MTAPYERLYDSPLLDELHNYFPAILYDFERFSSFADVLQYVASETQNRFDLYSNGRARYFRTHPRSTAPSTTTPRTTPTVYTQPGDEYVFRWATNLGPVPAVPALPIPTMGPEVEAQWNDIENIVSGRNAALNETTSFLSLLTAALGGGLTAPRRQTTAAAANAFMTPVVVRPTIEQITAGSLTDFVGAVTETPCAICQSAFQIGEERRTLIRCNHEFHRGCIDTWFNQNVRCPVCRHDIRENA